MNNETEFNSNAEQLRQLNELFEEAHYFSRLALNDGLDYSALNKYKTTISRIKVVLTGHLGKYDKRLKKYTDELNKVGDIIKVIHYQEYKEYRIISDNFNKYYSILEKIEILFRIIATKNGMLLTTKKGFGDD